MTRRWPVGVVGVVFGLACAGSARAQAPAVRSSAAYEVWVVDQSDSPGREHGGTLYIFRGADLAGRTPASAKTAERRDLGAETSTLCRERTGAVPVRPHMLLFNREHTHAALAFVASGHVVIFDAASRKPLECIRASASPTGRQAHAAFPSNDGSYILVANQNGKRLERIDSNFRTGTFALNEAAMLDLAGCTTPSGAPCQAVHLRPDNAPICPVVSEAGDLAFVTLRGGGMFVVDPRATPMRILAEYDMRTVKGNGCGGAEQAGRMFVNSGGRPGPMEHLHVYGFDVYGFALDAFRRAAGALPPNTPAPRLVFSAGGQHDSHGMVLTGAGRYLWVMDRHADVVEILGTTDNAHVRQVALNGALTNNAAPDLADAAPAGDRVFVALRGPTPLSGDPHNARGSTPGLGVLEVLDGGRNARLSAVVRLTNVGTDGV
ncbi:MAG TPA: hypothetical protein VE379_05955, partial [Vicinamibacterales bacterium]|nr:hypothetical protein [Vicinamibacterales bacterium]